MRFFVMDGLRIYRSSHVSSHNHQRSASRAPSDEDRPHHSAVPAIVLDSSSRTGWAVAMLDAQVSVVACPMYIQVS